MYQFSNKRVYFTKAHICSIIKRDSSALLLIIMIYSSQSPLRTCDLAHSCGSNQIEDEFHLLFNCTKYCTFRDKFYKKNRESNTKHNTITSYASHQKINEF